jgi:hypothetical protein
MSQTKAMGHPEGLDRDWILVLALFVLLVIVLACI